MNRRDVLVGAGLAAGLIAVPPTAVGGGPKSMSDWLQSPAFDDYVRGQLDSASTPGMSLGIIYEPIAGEDR